MKFPFSSDEIHRGIVILGLGIVLGVILGFVRWCAAIPPEPQFVLPTYNPFEEGLSPDIITPPTYSDFHFSFPGMPRFLPGWQTLKEPEDVLTPETFEEEWGRLGDPVEEYPDDAQLEKALDDLILGR